MAEREYREGAHTIYDLKYHLVWVTKYRHKVLRGEIGTRTRDLVRKLYRYADAGLPRYWIADPLECNLSAYVLRDGKFEDVAHAVGDEEIEFDFGVGKVALRPSDLLR